VASAVAAVNSAPVAVVHPDHAPDGLGGVVVGVDSSRRDAAVMGFAFAEAAIRRVQLLVVHTFREPTIEGFLPDFPRLLDPAAIAEEEKGIVSEALAGWSAKYPDVAVSHEIRRGLPATVLLEHSPSASLLVVGRRARADFESLVLGSTSRSLAAHSLCPVVIVGPDTRWLSGPAISEISVDSNVPDHSGPMVLEDKTNAASAGTSNRVEYPQAKSSI
jgi:nucleotide-binding universal stress UspA family protein